MYDLHFTDIKHGQGFSEYLCLILFLKKIVSSLLIWQNHIYSMENAEDRGTLDWKEGMMIKMGWTSKH